LRETQRVGILLLKKLQLLAFELAQKTSATDRDVILDEGVQIEMVKGAIERTNELLHSLSKVSAIPEASEKLWFKERNGLLN